MTHVVNIRGGQPCDVYIGRGGPFGNPYVLGADGDREEVIRKYQIYLYDRMKRDPEFKEKLEKLRGLRLGCFCAPSFCHGNVITEYLDGISCD